MELIKNRWSVSKVELERLGSLTKPELMAVIKSFNLGTGTLSRKRLEKDVYNTIKTATKSKKVHTSRASKRSKRDNTEGQEGN